MKHLLGIADLSTADLRDILARAGKFANDAERGKFPSKRLQGRVVVNMFFENSTRTRTSFEMAALRLGASVINWDPEKSSLSKGESFSDTLRTLDALAPDALIMRHSEYNAPHFAARLVRCPVINAGDSWHEHPTQALLDALTVIRRRGKIEGLRLAVCGDVAHSRVAHSNIILFTRLGARVRVIAPDFLMPEKFPVEGVEKFTSMEEGLSGCDLVMMLRNQKERMNADLIPNDATFFRLFGLTPERLRLANPEALVMHPAPMNRGVEIADEVADDPARSVIFEQMKNGVPLRMAVLDLLING